MTLLHLLWSFFQVGLFSIGGGYAAMPLIQSQVVDQYGWLTMREFTDLITIAEMTPGPIAVNSATFVGIRIAGFPGALITVRLPLTLAIIQALMVEIRDEKYAIALGSISNIEDIPVKDIKYVEAQEVIHLRGKVIPLIRMDQVLDIEPKEEEPESLTVVIVQKGENLAGLVVDNLIGQQEIVIKSLGKYINNNKIISGATILGDGEVALILDVNVLM